MTLLSPTTLTPLVLGACAVAALTACGAIVGIDGSGVAETTSYEFDSFDEVDVSNAFEVEITIVDGPPSVEVTVDDNLVEHLDVDVDSGRLEIGWRRGTFDPDVQPFAAVTMPSLTALELSGASSATVEGAEGASLRLELSGASSVAVDGDVERLDVDGSGASALTYRGRADDVTLDLSGASKADLLDTTTQRVTVDLSGASSADVGVAGRVDGDLSGASTLRVPDNADLSVDTSGASSIERR